MGSVGPLQLVVVIVVALLLFGGRGRISAIMGDMAKGIRSFRKGLAEEDDDPKAVSKEEMVNVTPEKEKTETSSS